MLPLFVTSRILGLGKFRCKLYLDLFDIVIIRILQKRTRKLSSNAWSILGLSEFVGRKQVLHIYNPYEMVKNEEC